MKLCILAAGIGSRLNTERPKALLQVGRLTIIERLMGRFVEAYSLEKIVIVTGFRHELIRNFLGEAWGGVPIEYVYNSEYETTENSLSLLLALPEMGSSDYWVCDADVIIDHHALPKTVPSTATLLVDPRRWDDESMKVCEDPAERLIRLTKVRPPEHYVLGESLGINFIPASYTESLKQALSRATGHYEGAFNELIEEGFVFRLHNLPADSDWREIDDKKDEAKATEMIASSGLDQPPIYSTLLDSMKRKHCDREVERVDDADKDLWSVIFWILQLGLFVMTIALVRNNILVLKFLFLFTFVLLWSARKVVVKSASVPLLRHVRLLEVVSDLLLVGVFAPGFTGFDFIATVVLGATFFLFAYSTIAYLLIIPADLRKTHPDFLMKLNRMYLRRGTLFRFSRDYIYAAFLVSLVIIDSYHAYILVTACALVGWLLQNAIIWNKLQKESDY